MAKVRLDDVAVEARETWNQDRKDVPVVGLEHLEPDEIWLRQWNMNPDENTFTKGFKKGQLLFGRRRAYQKKMSLALCDGICSGDITVIAARPEKIVPDLLPFYLRTDAFFDFAMRGSGGSLSPRVKWSHISDYEFDLPPMDEQKKLAELLWAANDLKESYKKAITATDEMLKAKFREMFGECGVMSAEGGVEDSRRGAEARSVELRDCITDILGGKTPSMSNSEFYGGDVPFIKSGDVREDYISEGSVWLSDKALSKGGAKYVPKGAVIIVVRSATLKNELRVAVAKQDVVINQDLKAFVPSQDYLPTFLMLAIRMQAEVLLSCVKTMLTSHIEVEEICKLPIPALSLSLQREFVAIADKAESAKANLKKSIAAIDQVMKGLING